MGLTPLMGEAGDLICILFGGWGLFLLRSQDDHYLLVAECYVHGIMEGQAMEWRDTTDQEFKLR